MSQDKSQQRVVTHIRDNGIAEVKLNRPDKLNALDIHMFTAITATIKRLKKNKSVRVVIVYGEGEDFSSGLDVKSIIQQPSLMAKLLWKWLPGNSNLAQKVSSGWRSLNVPVIMAIHGRCWGGGLQIALGGDFRIVHPESSLSIMESHWGLIPDMAGNMSLRNILPLDHALQLAMTAEKLTGKNAVDMNLATSVSEQPLDAARELAEQLLERSPDVLAALKKLYINNWQKSDRSMLAKESWYQVRILMGKNQKIASKKAMGKDADYVAPKTW